VYRVGTGGAHSRSNWPSRAWAHFMRVDRDVCQSDNVVARHPRRTFAGFGRAKVNGLHALIHRKKIRNAQVVCSPSGRCQVLTEMIAGLGANADLVSANDNRQSKLLINELCVSQQTAVLWRASRRCLWRPDPAGPSERISVSQCFVSALRKRHRRGGILR